MASAAILVGGRARRFGDGDKSALVVGGKTILEWQVAGIAHPPKDVMIVGAKAALGAAFVRRIPRGDKARPYRYVEDRVLDSGPLGGLDAALAAAHDDPLILLACDMPFVTSQFLEYLVSNVDGFDA